MKTSKALTLLVIIATSLFTATNAWALTNCPEDNQQVYHNCFGSLTFAKWGTYVGEFKDNKYNGQGTYTYINGDKYVGQWKADVKHGYGVYTFASGNIYEGEWKSGELSS